LCWFSDSCALIGGDQKDKEAPKKPRSSYIVFLDRHREEIRVACPDMQMKEVTSALAKQWQHVT
jgi:hypothetical protein